MTTDYGQFGWWERELRKANNRIAELEAERKLCVTTEYHDSIVEEAMGSFVAQLEAEVKALKKALEGEQG